MNEPALIQEILTKCKTIAVVGLTNKEGRASFGVSRFMQSRGYRIIPVNPLIESALGEKAYSSLEAACTAVDGIQLVNVFRAPRYISGLVGEVIRLKLPYLWLQEGVVDATAAERAEAAGVRVVMDRCVLKERMSAGWN